MKKQKGKILLISIIILISCIFLFQSGKSQNNKFQDELIFFKVFSFGQKVPENTIQYKNQMNQSHQQYTFQVSYKNIDFKNIYLSDTTDKDTLIREKIAPRNQRNI